MPGSSRCSLVARCQPYWSITGSIEPKTGRLVRLEVRYLSDRGPLQPTLSDILRPVVGIEGLPRVTLQVVNSSVVPQLSLSMAKDQILHQVDRTATAWCAALRVSKITCVLSSPVNVDNHEANVVDRTRRRTASAISPLAVGQGGDVKSRRGSAQPPYRLCWLRLNQFPGVVAKQGLDAVGPLGRLLQEGDALTFQLLVGAPDVIGFDDAGPITPLATRPRSVAASSSLNIGG